MWLVLYVEGLPQPCFVTKLGERSRFTRDLCLAVACGGRPLWQRNGHTTQQQGKPATRGRAVGH